MWPQIVVLVGAHRPRCSRSPTSCSCARRSAPDPGRGHVTRTRHAASRRGRLRAMTRLIRRRPRDEPPPMTPTAAASRPPPRRRRPRGPADAALGRPRRDRRGRAALAIGELVAAFSAGAPSPVAAVGTAVIDFAPPGSKELMVAPVRHERQGGAHSSWSTARGARRRRRDRAPGPAAPALAAIAIVGAGRRRARSARSASPTAHARPACSLSAAIQAIVGILVLELLLGGRAGGRRRRRRRRRPPAGTRRRAAGSWSGLACSASWRWSAAGSAGRWSTAAPQQVAARGDRDPAGRGPGADPGARRARSTSTGLTPLVVPNDELLPDRHRAHHAEGGRRRLDACGSTAWWTARSR